MLWTSADATPDEREDLADIASNRLITPEQIQDAIAFTQYEWKLDHHLSLAQQPEPPKPVGRRAARTTTSPVDDTSASRHGLPFGDTLSRRTLRNVNATPPESCVKQLTRVLKTCSSASVPVPRSILDNRFPAYHRPSASNGLISS